MKEQVKAIEMAELYRGVAANPGMAGAITARFVTHIFCARAVKIPESRPRHAVEKARCLCCNPDLDPMPMAEKPVLNPEPPRRRKRGRPTCKEEVRRALAEIGVDPRTVDPLSVLASIMMDATLPASARVQAARALIAARQGPAEDSAAGSDVAQRAIKLMTARKAH
jgi:hypothetical protein